MSALFPPCMAAGPGPGTLGVFVAFQAALILGNYWLQLAVGPPAEPPASAPEPPPAPAQTPPPLSAAPCPASAGYSSWVVIAAAAVTFLAGVGAAVIYVVFNQALGGAGLGACVGALGGWAASSAKGATSVIANSPIFRGYRHGSPTEGSSPIALDDW